ncbi:MAG: glycosyltransferase [Planctomycetaceae bacterium]
MREEGDNSTSITCLVVPCYNEARRLPVEQYDRFLEEHAEVALLFVNDGSTDETAEVLAALCHRHPQQADCLTLQQNSGKAEAVRQGFLYLFGNVHLFERHHAGDKKFARRIDRIGFWDADLSTPLDAVTDFIALMERHSECEIVIGSRVRLLGRRIERRWFRHYLGRVFATAASLTLRLPVYDTQCGAKLFRAAPRVERLFHDPFCTRWIFDVELLARHQQELRKSNDAEISRRVVELPLLEWRDVGGSKLKWTDYLRAIGELFRIWRRYRDF